MIGHAPTLRRRTDDKRDAERAEAERLCEEGKHLVSIGWGDPDGDKRQDGPIVEHEPQSSNKD